MAVKRIASSSLTESKRVALKYIDEHRFLPDYTKQLAKEVVVRHFQSLSNAIGAIELAARRAESVPKRAAKRKAEQ